MIAQCGQCQSRFRISDEKVTEEGVTVRCTSCQNTFRVTRPSQGMNRSRWHGRALGGIVCAALAVVAAGLTSAPLRVWRQFFPSEEWAVVDSARALYETADGKSVFYVEGEVENRTGVRSRAQIRAEILDGSELIRAAEGIAGALPNPEEIYTLGSAEDAEALRARLDEKGLELGPGERAPFLLIFYEYPPGLSSYRLKVSAQSNPLRSASLQ